MPEMTRNWTALEKLRPEARLAIERGASLNILSPEQRRMIERDRCQCRYCDGVSGSPVVSKCERCQNTSLHRLQKCPQCGLWLCIDFCTAGGTMICMRCYSELKANKVGTKAAQSTMTPHSPQTPKRAIMKQGG